MQVFIDRHVAPQRSRVFFRICQQSFAACLSRPAIRLTVFFFIVAFALSSAHAQNNVLTQHNDVARSGLNPNETILTPANVNSNQFGKLFTQNVDGIIAAQPLYVSQIQMVDGLVHNVVFVVTQHNSVFAFDADSIQGADANPIWSVSLDDGGTSDPISDYGCTGTHYTEIGIMGTPVIDPGITTLYVVAKTLNNGVRNFYLHALNLTNGSETLGGPVVITGNVPSGNGTGVFNPIYQMQRPALLYQNGEVYVGFGGNGCDEYAYNGWLFAYNAQSLNQDAQFSVTPNGVRASLWGGGTGPSVDEFGNIYIVTANGTFDGPNGKDDYGDSVLKMGWDGSSFGILDYFTPYNQATLANQDLDLGSAAALILPDQPGTYPHEMIVGGKQGTLYVVNRDNLGQYNPTTDDVIQELPKIVNGELHGSPTYWNGSVYVGAAGDYLKQFGLVNGQLTSTPLSQTSVDFTGNGPASTSISANGTSNAILWAMQHVAAGTLFAFDPTNLANEFYNSNQAAKLRDKLGGVIRFATPTVSNGKVYIGGTSALTVYGLLPSLSDVAGNNQTGSEKQVLPVGLTVLASDSYAGSPIAGASVTCKDGGVGGVFTPSGTQTTGSNGTVTFTYQLPAKPQVVTITCSSTGLLNTTFTETSQSPGFTHFQIVSGNNQSGYRGTQLASSFVLKALDASGYAVPGVSVTFTDNGAGGSFSPNPATTASNGNATTVYTTGTTLGKITVTGSAQGITSPKITVTTVVGPAAAIAVTGGNNQVANAGTKLSQPLTALVTDPYSSPVPGVAVTFSDNGAGGIFGYTNPVTTDKTGTATQTYTLPSTPATVTITATVSGVSTAATFSETGVADPPAAIQVSSGNNQSAQVGNPLPQPLVVLVTDQNGNPLSGVSVTFSDNGAGGKFGTNPENTGGNGTASETYTFSTTPGNVTITATVAGVSTPATFTETALAGNPTSILITGGNNQSAAAGSTLPAPLSVEVTDQYGNPISGVSVAWSDGGAGGTFSYANPGPTGSGGIASQVYTLPTTPGTVTITATASGIATPATFTETGH